MFEIHINAIENSFQYFLIFPTYILYKKQLYLENLMYGY